MKPLIDHVNHIYSEHYQTMQCCRWLKTILETGRLEYKTTKQTLLQPCHNLVQACYFCIGSVVFRPMLVVFSLGMRLRVHMHTYLQNGILRNEQQPQSVVMLYWLGWIWSYKGAEWSRALRWDKHQSKMTVSTQTVFKMNIVALVRKNTKMALSLPHTFDLAVFYEAFGQLYESC